MKKTNDSNLILLSLPMRTAMNRSSIVEVFSALQLINCKNSNFQPTLTMHAHKIIMTPKYAFTCRSI